MNRVLLIACAIVAVGGCSTKPVIKPSTEKAIISESRFDAETRAVAQQAVFELGCRALGAPRSLGETVEVANESTSVTRTNYGVEGCGLSATYIVECAMNVRTARRNCTANRMSTREGGAAAPTAATPVQSL